MRIDRQRRNIVATGLAIAACAVVRPICALPFKAEKSITLYHAPSGEHFAATYWRNGTYDPKTLGAIHHLLRDRETGAVHPIDPRLIDFLQAIQQKLSHQGAIEVVSGYRAGQASSLHAHGMAADISMPGISPAAIHQAALSLAQGNAHYYPGAPFVHIDVG